MRFSNVLRLVLSVGAKRRPSKSSCTVSRPGYDIKLHPVVEFGRGRMRLPFAATTSRSPLSKV